MCPAYDITSYGGHDTRPAYVVPCLRGSVMCPAYNVTA